MELIVFPEATVELLFEEFIDDALVLLVDCTEFVLEQIAVTSCNGPQGGECFRQQNILPLMLPSDSKTGEVWGQQPFIKMELPPSGLFEEGVKLSLS